MPLRERKPLEKKVDYPELYVVLKEGHTSLVDADKVDGLHATEIATGGGIPSTPPEGGKKVLNIWWDAVKQELVFEHES